MTWIFSNVYHWQNSNEFERSIEGLNIRQSDRVVFLNKCIPLVKNAKWFISRGVDIVTCHRHKDSTERFFWGYDDVKNKCNVNLKNHLLVYNSSICTVDGREIYHLSEPYTKDKTPTTGFIVADYFNRITKGNIKLVNFYGSDDESTCKWSGHDWKYENNIMKTAYDVVLLDRDASVFNSFDKKVIIGCDKFYGRIEKVNEELERVGLIDSVEYSIDHKNPFLEKLNNAIRFANTDAKRYFRCGYNHYQAILSAYNDGCSSILMIEDDIVFPKDPKFLWNGVGSIPLDYELCQLDKNCNGLTSEMEYYTGKTGWVETRKRFGSSGCYSLSRNGMRKWMDAYENALKVQMLNNDLYFTKDTFGENGKRYVAMPNLAIQRYYQNSSCHHMDLYLINLRKWGTDLDRYNLSITDVAQKIFSYATSGDTINEVVDRIIKLQEGNVDVRIGPRDNYSCVNKHRTMINGITIIPRAGSRKPVNKYW